MQIPKRKPYRSAAYLDYVRAHPCCACGSPPTSEAHHFMRGGGGMALKVDDTHTVPLCRACHNRWHAQAYFPCFDFERDEKSDRGFDEAHRSSVELMYRTEARLLSSWIQRAERGAGTDGRETLF